jgi:hypothetical protein
MKKILFLLALILLKFSFTTQAQIPKTLTIQGSLNDAHNSKAAPDGAYDLRFELYDANQNGNLLWSETQEGVLVVNGIFNVILGKREPLDSTLLSPAHFLQIQHLSGRTQLGTPNALSSSHQVTTTALFASLVTKGQQVTDMALQPASTTDTLTGIDPQANTRHKDKFIITPGGYVESFYSYNFNRPENNITALRGFDFIHNSLTLSNIVMSTDASYKNFSARVALNFGLAPTQFYKQEPVTTPSYQVPAINVFTWQFIQEALIGWDVEWVPGLTIQTGIMATPIGIEGLPNYQTWKGSMNSPHMKPKDYRENWHWSRSNAFMNVPDYHSGVRALYSVNSNVHLGAFLLNGWNEVTDKNTGKTVALSALWMPSPGFSMSGLYMGGPERPTGSPEGNGWRHLFDYNVRWEVTRNLAFMTQFAPGFEKTNFGTNWWTINAFYASWKFDNDVRLAFRYEHLLERTASGSSTVFLQSKDENNFAGLYGYTGTLSVPIVPDHLMLRLEYRHDKSNLNWFYKGNLEPSSYPDYPFIPNAKNQHTLTMGLVGWF